MRAIADIQVDILRKRLVTQDIKLRISEESLDLIGEAGFDPVYGARPLKRAIQSLIENPLAQKLLAGEFSPGDTVSVGLVDDALSFEKALQH